MITKPRNSLHIGGDNFLSASQLLMDGLLKLEIRLGQKFLILLRIVTDMIVGVLFFWRAVMRAVDSQCFSAKLWFHK